MDDIYSIAVKIDDVWETMLAQFFTKEECQARIIQFQKEFPMLEFSVIHTDLLDDTYWEYLFSIQGLEID